MSFSQKLISCNNFLSISYGLRYRRCGLAAAFGLSVQQKVFKSALTNSQQQETRICNKDWIQLTTPTTKPFQQIMAKPFSTAGLIAKHEPDKTRFVVYIDKDEAFLEYEVLKSKTASFDILNLYHTLVPDVFRGKSVGKLLAKAAFDYVVDNNCKMMLSCTYLQHYYDTSDDNDKSKYKDYILEF